MVKKLPNISRHGKGLAWPRARSTGPTSSKQALESGQYRHVGSINLFKTCKNVPDPANTSIPWTQTCWYLEFLKYAYLQVSCVVFTYSVIYWPNYYCSWCLGGGLRLPNGSYSAYSHLVWHDRRVHVLVFQNNSTFCSITGHPKAIYPSGNHI